MRAERTVFINEKQADPCPFISAAPANSPWGSLLKENPASQTERYNNMIQDHAWNPPVQK